jgi:hypothetical protein
MTTKPENRIEKNDKPAERDPLVDARAMVAEADKKNREAFLAGLNKLQQQYGLTVAIDNDVTIQWGNQVLKPQLTIKKIDS